MAPFVVDFTKTASLTFSDFTLTPTVSVHHEGELTFDGGSLSTVMASFSAEVSTMTAGSAEGLHWAFNSSSGNSEFVLDFELDVPAELSLTGSMSVEPVEGANFAQSVYTTFRLNGPGPDLFSNLSQTGAQSQALSLSRILEPGNYNLLAGLGVSLAEADRLLTGGKAMLEFLMTFTPLELGGHRWTNTSGGNWDLTANWSGNVVPEEGDEAVFDLSGAYAVTFPESAVVEAVAVEQGDVAFDLGGNTLAVQGGVEAGIAVEPGASLTIGGGNLSAQAIRARGARLTFAPGSQTSVLNDVRSEFRSDRFAEIVMQGGMNVAGDIIVSGDPGSIFEVSGGGFLGARDLIMDGRLSFVDVEDGAALFQNARVHGGTLTVSGESMEGVPSVLSVAGEAILHPGSQALVGEGAEAMFHNLLVNTGSTLPGEEIAAGLLVRNGGKVTADQIAVGSSQPASIAVLTNSSAKVTELVLNRGLVNVKGAGAMLDVQQSLTIAASDAANGATLNAEAGGVVNVLGDVDVGSPGGGVSAILIDGERTRFKMGSSGGAPGRFAASAGSVVWISGGAGATFNDLSISGDLQLFGDGVVGFAENVTVGETAGGSVAIYAEADLFSSDATVGLNHPSTAAVEDGASWSVGGTLRVGPTQGVLTIESGGVVEADNVLIATPSGDALGAVAITGSSGPDGDPSLLKVSNVLTLGSAGTLSIDTDAAVTVGQTTPLPGFIRVGPGGDLFGFGTLVGNVVNQGGTVHQGSSPGALTIDGDFVQEAHGALEIEIGGLDAGVNHDQLIVTGNADIEGIIQLKFFDGFAPQQGQQFEFLNVGGEAMLTAASFEIQHLLPGFEFDIAPSANGISMIALNDGEFLQPVTWNVNADGDWSLAENWSAGDPNVAGVSASFLDVTTAPRTINIDAPTKVASLTFDSENGYTFAGPGPLQFESGGYTSIQVTSGEHVISAPLSIAEGTTLTKRGAGTLTINGAQDHGVGAILVANGGAINLNSDGGSNLSVQANSSLNFGATQHLAGVTIGKGGKTTLTSGGSKNLVTGTLSISGGETPTGTLDLTDNAAIIDFPAAGPNPAAETRQQILAGRGASGFGATWTGSGITSSVAADQVLANPESVSIAYAVNGELPLGPYTEFHGEAVDDSAVLIRLTRTGDANLDGVANDDDVTIVSATFAPGVPQPHWALGDFDYNGFVDDDDVTLLGVFYSPSAPPLVSPTPVTAEIVAAVPEPASFAFAVLAAAAVAALVRANRAQSRDSAFML